MENKNMNQEIKCSGELALLVETLERSAADAWQITETETRGWEFYFIRHALDQNRVRTTCEREIQVFRKLEEAGELFLGSATAVVPPGLSRAELEKTVGDLCYQATLVKNPYYELVSPAAGNGEVYGEAPDVPAIARDFLEAMRQVPETATEDINSYELFIDDVTRRILNSRGVDVTTRYPASAAEVIVNARDGAHEIELYRMIKSGTCDREALQARITEALGFARDKLVVENTPHLKKSAVVFSTEAAVSLYRFFLEQSSGGFRYQKLCDWELGKPIAENVTGDRVTLRALAALPGSAANYAWDEEGSPIRERVLIQDHVLRERWGSRQFASYLGPDEMGTEASSIVHNFQVTGGTSSEEELRQGDHLEGLEFSAFYCDPMTGDFLGEIRLGYARSGGETKIVSGGSVSGNMKECLRSMRMSRETCQYNTAVIPKVTRLENVNVTGVEAACVSGVE